MKFAWQDKYGEAVVNCLRIHGPHTIREVAEILDFNVCRIDTTMRRLMCKGYVEPTGERKGTGSGRAAIYRWVDVEDPEEIAEDDDRIRTASMYARAHALMMADELVRTLRTDYKPAVFDPFRVLRVQVGA